MIEDRAAPEPSAPETTETPLPRRRRGERGFLLLGVMTSMLILGILSGVGVQEWSVVERRDREQQLIFVMEQYAAAIDRYQRGQGALPTDIEQLTKKGQKGEYYLRKPYTDPMVRDAKIEDWCLLKVGGTGQVVSSCDESGGIQGSQEGLEGSFGGKDEHSAAGPKLNRRGASSSMNPDFGRNFGTTGRLGEEGSPNRPSNVPGVATGQTGIVGVASRSGEQAYYTKKFDAETYSEWQYTIEDYKKDASMRNIPGLPTKSGPGLSNPNDATRQQGNVGFSDPFSSGSGLGKPKSGSSGSGRKR